MESGRMAKSQSFSSKLGTRVPTLLGRHARSNDTAPRAIGEDEALTGKGWLT